MKRPKIHPPQQLADPAHISAVRRAAALAGAKVRAERSLNKGRRPRAVNIRPDVFDRLDDYAKGSTKPLTQAATEIIDDGLTRLHNAQ